MRTIAALFFTFRLLLLSSVVYHFSRLLPAHRRSRMRQRVTLWSARKIADFFLNMGGIYIKAAQFMATVSNLFDAEFTEIFGDVPDQVVPRPYEDIRYRFLAEFGVEPEKLYLEFDRSALAAASLGQVHLARVKDGRRVAVKFLHPNMESRIRQDLRALRFCVNMILWFYPYLDFRGHFYEFTNMLLSEIDYENEAENLRRIRWNFKDDPRIVVPEVIEELSGATVLTTEYIEGIQCTNLHGLDRAGVDRKGAAELLLEAYARMVFDDRFYHADPHPGNLFIIPSDSLHPMRLALVDFGAAQNVTERMLSLMERAIEIMRRRDIPALVELGLESGMLAPHADAEVYTNLFELIHARYGSFKIDDTYRINPVRFGRMIKLRDLMAVGLRLRDLITTIRLPHRYIYLGRTMTMLLSLAMRMDEKVNIFMVARPHVEKYLQSRPRGLRWYLRRGNLQQALRGVLPKEAGSTISFSSGKSNSEDVTLRLGRQGIAAFVGVSGSFLAAYLYLGGAQLVAQYVLVAPALCFLYVLKGMLRRR